MQSKQMNLGWPEDKVSADFGGNFSFNGGKVTDV